MANNEELPIVQAVRSLLVEQQFRMALARDHHQGPHHRLIRCMRISTLAVHLDKRLVASE